MFHVTLILALLLCASRATDGSVDWFRNWFDDQLKEIIDEPLVLNIVGTIPKYVQGRLVRVGPTQLITKGHNLTNYLDGFGRISTWGIDGSSSAGQVKFMSAFIRSNLYNASIPADDVSPHITQEPTQKRTPPGKFDLDTMDNTDVNVHRSGNEETVMVMTDFYIANDIDMGSLRTLHVSNITGSVPHGSTFSGSHPATWVNPVTGEELLVNWVGAKGPKYFELSVYIMGQDRVRHVRGHVMLEHQPYSIHSIAVADNFCIVTIGPVSLDFIKSGITLCVSCSTENNMDNGQTMVYAFDLLGGHADSRPVISSWKSFLVFPPCECSSD
jgi:carotenoid cleavage dioxygenase-like enzyme